MSTDRIMTWLSRIATILLIVLVAWGYWLNYERVNLNKNNEKLIEEREAINQRYAQLVDRMEVENDALSQELQDLQNRFQDYLDRLEGKVQGSP